MFFESLFRSSKWTWLFGWTFHAALFVVLVRHVRYFQQPVWEPVVMVQAVGAYAGFAMVAGLAGLWARRWLVDRVRYISTPSDHLHLVLLLAIGASGLAMRFFNHTDIVAVKTFTLGLMRLDLNPLPLDPPLLIHLALVAVPRLASIQTDESGSRIISCAAASPVPRSLEAPDGEEIVVADGGAGGRQARGGRRQGLSRNALRAIPGSKCAAGNAAESRRIL